MSQRLSSASFQECIHTSFEVGIGDTDKQNLELIRVTDYDASPQLEQFSLIFRGRNAPVMEQRIYPVRHEKLGSLSLFFVPIGPDEQGMCYEVAFNRFRQDKPAQS